MGGLTQHPRSATMIGLMRIKAIFTILVLLVVSAYVGAEIKDLESYGICVAFTDIDEFTDEIIHALICGSKVKIDPTKLSDFSKTIDDLSGEMVLASCKGADQVVGFAIPFTFFGDNEDSGNVRYRFDKGEVYEESWSLPEEEGSGTAHTDDPNTVSNFLEKMANIELSFVFELRDKIYKLDFSETDVSGATSDYVDRCSG